MEQVQKKPYQWLSWFGTAVLVAGATFAAFNIYPLYVWTFLFGNVVWATIGYLWKEESLIALNAGLSVIYIIGLLI